MQTLIDEAPQLPEFLGDDSRRFQDQVVEILSQAGVPFRSNPRLVRGLDYYNLTVFEWVTDLLGAQGTVCGGGRYDGLIEMMGGKPTPACGFAIGAERLIALLQACAPVTPASVLDVYVMHWGDGSGPQAVALSESLRGQGLSVQTHAGGGSVKSQMKKADASGARLAAILGEDERAAGQVTLKPLRGQADQTTISWSQAVASAASLVTPPHLPE
jgi:histidyl-tRNA synthetase